jgi:TonB-dependent receptor
MATVNIGPQIAITPGIRYQGLRTSYTANRFIGNADAYNPFPATLPYSDTTTVEYHGYWLPDVNLKYDPFDWLSFRAAYTNTLVYPDFNQIIPILDVGGNYVNWNNPDLKPSQSHNYDVQVSAYNNEVGLLAVSPFLKQIDDLIFYQGTHITDPSEYPGVPSYTKGYSLYTNINNPYQVNLWGVETEWQTHFWYLPYPFDGLVLNVNYTHIFSSAKYPYTITRTGGYPPKTTYVDTFYTARLLQQPNDLVNLSIGYDYRKFSVLASMIYQTQVYSGTNFYNSYRYDKAKYVRWDLAAHQGLPWFGLEAFLDISNLNSENDIYTERGSGFPTSESDYGMIANLGLKWTY